MVRPNEARDALAWPIRAGESEDEQLLLLWATASRSLRMAVDWRQAELKSEFCVGLRQWLSCCMNSLHSTYHGCV